jgi:hypothetical protein
MIDFMFFIKTLALTVAIVMLMQIQIGDRTVEKHAVLFVQSSTVASPLNTVARGASKLIHDVTGKIWSGVHHNVKKKAKKEDSKASSFFWQHSSETAPPPDGSED